MALRVFLRTLPYVLMRGAIYLAFGAALLVFVGIMGGLSALMGSVFPGAGGPLFLVGLITLAGLWGIMKLAGRYVLYLVKIGHVAVITEILTQGDLPAGVDQFRYGRERVTRHFGSTTVFFAVDQLLAHAVRQMLGWLTALGGCALELPLLNTLGKLFRVVIRVATGYIDEAAMSYILSHEDEDIWQAAADGVVLYVQSWKRLLGTATILVLGVAGVWLVSFGALLLPLLGLARALSSASGGSYALFAVIAAAIGAQWLRWLIVDPIATVAMIVSYQQEIAGQEPELDVRSELAGVSAAFRQLTQRADGQALTEWARAQG